MMSTSGLTKERTGLYNQTKFIFTMTKLELASKIIAMDIKSMDPEKVQEYISAALKEFARDAVNSVSPVSEITDRKMLIEYGLIYSYKKDKFI